MKISTLLLPVLIILSTQGCSREAWYEGLRQGRIHECQKLPDTAQQECLQETNQSYHTYLKERRKVTNRKRQ